MPVSRKYSKKSVRKLSKKKSRYSKNKKKYSRSKKARLVGGRRVKNKKKKNKKTQKQRGGAEPQNFIDNLRDKIDEQTIDNLQDLIRNGHINYFNRNSAQTIIDNIPDDFFFGIFCGGKMLFFKEGDYSTIFYLKIEKRKIVGNKSEVSNEYLNNFINDAFNYYKKRSEIREADPSQSNSQLQALESALSTLESDDDMVPEAIISAKLEEFNTQISNKTEDKKRDYTINEIIPFIVKAQKTMVSREYRLARETSYYGQEVEGKLKLKKIIRNLKNITVIKET